MRSVKILVQSKLAGTLDELDDGSFRFTYLDGYSGPPVSLTMPITQTVYAYKTFPPFFEGVLPEGFHLEALLRREKIDRNDLLTQLISVGADLVGAVTVEAVTKKRRAP